MMVANEVWGFFYMCIQTASGTECKGALRSNNTSCVRKTIKGTIRCTCNNNLLTVIFAWCHKIKYYCWIILWSARMFAVLCLQGISHRMSLWFWDICGGFFLPYARQHSPTGQGYYPEAPGWPASTHWILELRIVISGWNGKSYISNDSSDSHDDKCFFMLLNVRNL